MVAIEKMKIAFKELYYSWMEELRLRWYICQGYTPMEAELLLVQYVMERRMRGKTTMNLDGTGIYKPRLDLPDEAYGIDNSGDSK